MIHHKEEYYVFQHNKHKTYYVSYSKSDTTHPNLGIRFNTHDAALIFRDSGGLFKNYNIKKVIVTIEVE